MTSNPPRTSASRSSSARAVRKAPFALRVVQRNTGKAAVIYRRSGDEEGRDRLQRIAALSPLAFTASGALLRDAIVSFQVKGKKAQTNPPRFDPRALPAGPFYPLDADWGARLASFAIISAGLRDAERLVKAAQHLRVADSAEAAWWLGLLTRRNSAGVRALRALRILTEAVS